LDSFAASSSVCLDYNNRALPFNVKDQLANLNYTILKRR